MKIRNLIIAAALLVALATPGFAQLSMAKADWARGPVQFLITKDEQAAWNAIKSDAEADKFIALFWARRDPTPGTPRNEFREEFEGRAAYADQTFGTGRQRGSLSDRGKALILFGKPTHAVRSGGPGGIARTTTPGATLNAAGAPAGSEAEDTSTAERQMWTYEGASAEKFFAAPKVELRFIDRLSNHDLRMETPRVDFAAAVQRAQAAAITQPNLTSIPAQQPPTPQPAAVVAPAAPVAPTTVLKTAAFDTAVTEAKAAKTPSKGMLSYAEFIAPTGDYYAPVELYVPASAGLTADSADTFFGAVEDATGKRVLAWEEPAKLTASKSDFFIDKTLNLPSGKYSVTFGLAKAGVPVLVTTAPVELSTLTKDSTGTSQLLLSDNVYEMTEAAPVKSPFAFGKLKIVPKASYVFSNKDELNYFVEIHNPGVDPATNLPKLQMKMDLIDSKGKTVAGAPLSDPQPLPLSGQVGPGQYAIINGIPLAKLSQPLPPGEYTLKMKIVDTISKQSYNLEQKFKITA
jgi:GWxTD domain-containing protein